MAHSVLIVAGLGDVALSELLMRALDEPDITVVQQTNTESALKYVKAAAPDFIVVSLALAADRSSPAEPGGGILFCEAARAISPAPRSIDGVCGPVRSASSNAADASCMRPAFSASHPAFES